MKHLLLITILAVTLLMGCLGQNGRHPVKQITAFLIAVPCYPATRGAVQCYEIVYEMMDTEPTPPQKDK